ncbi:MAG: hypothetical protein LBM19_03665 [Holosporales bacterium]|jgi:hypothetical protein|nr:hypothetical protein [Holosporales bacterium]
MNAEESEQAFNAVKQKGTNKESNSEKHRVSGIFYVNEDNWTVWIDNVPYSSTGQKGDFSIEAVTEKTATLTTQNGSIIELSVEQGDDESNKNDKEKNCE